MNLLMPLAAMLMLAAPPQDPPAEDAKVAAMIGDGVPVVVHVDLANWKPEPAMRRGPRQARRRGGGDQGYEGVGTGSTV